MVRKSQTNKILFAQFTSKKCAKDIYIYMWSTCDPWVHLCIWVSNNYSNKITSVIIYSVNLICYKIFQAGILRVATLLKCREIAGAGWRHKGYFYVCAFSLPHCLLGSCHVTFISAEAPLCFVTALAICKRCWQKQANLNCRKMYL